MLFVLRDQYVIDRCCAEITQSLGKVVEIRDAKRSLDQNAFYWAILEIIGRHTGDSKLDLHDNLKWVVLGPQQREYKGQSYMTVKASSKLSKKDFGQLIDAAEMLAAQLNVILPTKRNLGLE